MNALASIALALGSERIVWQALDWNLPALNFYKRLGAIVQDGLTCSKFTSSTIQDLASRTMTSTASG